MSTLFGAEGDSLIFATHPRKHIEYDYLAVTVAGSFDSFMKYRFFLYLEVDMLRQQSAVGSVPITNDVKGERGLISYYSIYLSIPIRVHL